ncbi:transcriptional regulator [Microbacterium lacticum]
MTGAEGVFDEVIHEKTRLRISAILSGVDAISFPQLRELVGVSDSVLSKHLKMLQEAGHVVVTKTRSAGRSRSSIAMSVSGRRAYHGHIAALNAMIAQVRAPDSTVADAALGRLLLSERETEKSS